MNELKRLERLSTKSLMESNNQSNITEVVKLLDDLEKTRSLRSMFLVENHFKKIRKYVTHEIPKGLDEINAIVSWCTKVIPVKQDHPDLEIFVYLQENAEGLREVLEKRRKHTTFRIAAIDFGIVDNEMSYTFDFVRFENEVSNLFQWFTLGEKGYKKYIAPYFALVQSSGTGKTFLLYNLQIEIDKQRKVQWQDVTCKLLVCGGNNDPGSNIHEFFNIDELIVDGKVNPVEVYNRLDKLIQDCSESKIVLLFDEAQHLLEHNDALLFWMVHWWLRLRRMDGKKIVAVFTGTTIKLSNYYPHSMKVPPLFLKKASDSRNEVTTVLLYYNDGIQHLQFHAPFFYLTTMGSIPYSCPPTSFSYLNEEGTSSTDVDLENSNHEYIDAVFFGRPLFAKLLTEGVLNFGIRQNILRRMLFDCIDDYDNVPFVWASILGTRVQMGYFSINVASRLVSNGYAHIIVYTPRNNLSHHTRLGEYEVSSTMATYRALDEDIVHISYLPDPVCAHLAMGMMDRDWNCEGLNNFNGRDKEFWVNKAKILFSSGICHPSQGNIGKVAAALYLLFCGDIQRKSYDRNYMTFSVDLLTFVRNIFKNRCSQNLSNDSSDVDENCEPSKFRISFIQVVRQYYHIELKDLCCHDNLEQLYLSSCAMYLPVCCQCFDILASIEKKHEDDSVSYLPLAVSVKSQQGFTTNEAIMAILAMNKCLVECGVKRGMCLLILLDLKRTESFCEIGNEHKKMLLENEIAINLFDNSISDNDFATRLVSKVVVIENNDSFGIDDLIQNTRPGYDEMCQLYASHWSLQNFADTDLNSEEGVKVVPPYYSTDLRKALQDRKTRHKGMTPTRL
jgi:hypothetical protein